LQKIYQMILSAKAKQLIRHRRGLRIRNRLAYELNVTSKTIDIWLANDDAILTSKMAIEILTDETGLAASELTNNNIL
jgi:hypothetical protein